MAPSSPVCSFIHASIAGSRSTAPLNRSNSDLIVVPFSFHLTTSRTKTMIVLGGQHVETHPFQKPYVGRCALDASFAGARTNPCFSAGGGWPWHRRRDRRQGAGARACFLSAGR